MKKKVFIAIIFVAALLLGVYVFLNSDEQLLSGSTLPETIGVFHRLEVSDELRNLYKEFGQIYIYEYGNGSPSKQVPFLVATKDKFSNLNASGDGTIVVGDFEIKKSGDDLFWITNDSLVFLLLDVLNKRDATDIIIGRTHTDEPIYAVSGGEERVSFIKQLVSLSGYDKEATKTFGTP